MNIKRCLHCYEPVTGETEIHEKCAKKFYGVITVPKLEYELSNLHLLAKELIKSRITVPGVQAKLSLAFNDYKRRDKLTIVGVWGNYILKTPSDIYPYIVEIEDLTMHLATLFKIETVPHSMIRLKSGELAYITKRVDREKDSKLHMEDFCQLSNRLTENKYKSSMERIGRTIMKYSSNPIADSLTLFELTLFSFITGNGDMHLKNFSLLYRGEIITLAPAYDLLSTRLLIPENKDNEELALTLNGKKWGFTKNDFISFAKNLKLNDKQINNVFKKFHNSSLKVSEIIDCSFLTEELKCAYKELILNRSSRL